MTKVPDSPTSPSIQQPSNYDDMGFYLAPSLIQAMQQMPVFFPAFIPSPTTSSRASSFDTAETPEIDKATHELSHVEHTMANLPRDTLLFKSHQQASNKHSVPSTKHAWVDQECINEMIKQTLNGYQKEHGHTGKKSGNSPPESVSESSLMYTLAIKESQLREKDRVLEEAHKSIFQLSTRLCKIEDKLAGAQERYAKAILQAEACGEMIKKSEKDMLEFRRAGQIVREDHKISKEKMELKAKLAGAEDAENHQSGDAYAPSEATEQLLGLSVQHKTPDTNLSITASGQVNDVGKVEHGDRDQRIMSLLSQGSRGDADWTKVSVPNVDKRRPFAWW